MHFQSIARLSAKLAVALVVVLEIASQASAATITATFTGTVKTATDTTGVFGTPGADLAGVGYSLVYKVDPTVGAYSPIVDPVFSGDQVLGGGISAVLTINGHSYSFPGVPRPAGTFDIAMSKPGFSSLAYQFGSDFASVAATLQTTAPGFPTSVFTAVSIASCPAGSCSFFGNFIIPGTPGHDLFGTLDFGSLTVSNLAATPIPATLPLLVSALGGLGFVGWRRKQNAAA
jgi:hypothetical protein